MTLDNNCFEYYENFLSIKESKDLFNWILNNVSFEQKEITLFGKNYLQPRLIAWFGEKDYTYSNTKLKKKEIPSELIKIKNKIEKISNSKFNSVLINLYRDENDSMGKHSDDEKELGINPTITSLSIGEEREFIITSKINKKREKINLGDGSLLIMKNDSQKVYSHELPKTKIKKEPRINLTFRFID